MKSAEIAKLLGVFQRFVEALPEAHVKHLLDGSGELRLFFESEHQDRGGKQRLSPRVVPSAVVEKLDSCAVRQAGMEILQPVSKLDLLAIAKYLDIHADRSLLKPQLAEKIVERTVGARLRRRAIDSLVAH